MNGAYGDWWESWTAPTAVLATAAAVATIPVAAISVPFAAGAAGLAITGAAAVDAYNWYYAVPSASAPLPTSAPNVKPAEYAVQQQQAAQIEAALARYNTDPLAQGKPVASWVWPAVAVAGIGVVAYTMSGRRGDRSARGYSDRGYRGRA